MHEPSRQVSIQGNAHATIIITGNQNRVVLHHGPGLAFRLLDEEFRRSQRQRQPADFYNGTRANWANIARGDDARRLLLDDLLAFIHNRDGQYPPQRVGVITGLSGEGKTTLLMRALWEAAEAGLPVLWRHHGTVSAAYERPFAGQSLVVIGIDDLPFVENLPDLVADLAESGLSFVLLGTARTHEWTNSGLMPVLARSARVHTFEVQRLQGEEVDDLLTRMEQRGALGMLADLPATERRGFFLSRLRADGQLLPALLTARRGRAFAEIIADVFAKLARLYGAERARELLRGYAGIALVHRFGFWMSRPLLARFTGIPERHLTPRLLRPLHGELTEITEVEERHLYTRHPWIAEHALQHLCARYIEEEDYLYEDLFRALGEYVREHPGAEERKLSTLLPLAFKYQDDMVRARQLFRCAARALPGNPVVYHAWALLEKEQGDMAKARELFQKAVQADPNHAPSYQAWALLEKEQGDIAKARKLFQQAVEADPKHAPSCQAWALLEKEQGNFDRARDLFQKAVQVDPKHAPSYQAWALLEARQGRPEEALRILEQGLARVRRRRWRALLHSAQGSVLARQGRYDRAEAAFREALRLNPRNPLTHYHYAMGLLLPQGRLDEACEHLRQAHALRARKARDRRRITRAWQRHCDSSNK